MKKSLKLYTWLLLILSQKDVKAFVSWKGKIIVAAYLHTLILSDRMKGNKKDDKEENKYILTVLYINSSMKIYIESKDMHIEPKYMKI